MNHPEDDIQRAVAQALDLAEQAARGTEREFRWWHTPNGGRRGKAEAGRFKGLGVKPGIPGILLLPRSGILDALELKAPGRKPTVDQREFLSFVTSIGGRATWVDSLDDALAVLRKWRYLK